jgi:kinetochore-associated protein 1
MGFLSFQFKQLSSLVNLLSANKSLLHIQGLALAWEYVIKEPFKSANRLKSVDQESILAKSFLLLQTCPVATSINLLELAENCIVLQRPHMAAIFIAYAKDEVKEKIIKVGRGAKGKIKRRKIVQGRSM